jgi:hypothetical protein
MVDNISSSYYRFGRKNKRSVTVNLVYNWPCCIPLRSAVRKIGRELSKVCSRGGCLNQYSARSARQTEILNYHHSQNAVMCAGSPLTRRFRSTVLRNWLQSAPFFVHCAIWQFCNNYWGQNCERGIWGKAGETREDVSSKLWKCWVGATH